MSKRVRYHDRIFVRSSLANTDVFCTAIVVFVSAIPLYGLIVVASCHIFVVIIVETFTFFFCVCGLLVCPWLGHSKMSLYNWCVQVVVLYMYLLPYCDLFVLCKYRNILPLQHMIHNIILFCVCVVKHHIHSTGQKNAGILRLCCKTSNAIHWSE